MGAPKCDIGESQAAADLGDRAQYTRRPNRSRHAIYMRYSSIEFCMFFATYRMVGSSESDKVRRYDSPALDVLAGTFDPPHVSVACDRKRSIAAIESRQKARTYSRSRDLLATQCILDKGKGVESHCIDLSSQEDEPRNSGIGAGADRKKMKREENTPAEASGLADALQYANTQDLLISQEPPTYDSDEPRALELSFHEKKSGSYPPFSHAHSNSECGSQNQSQTIKENEIPRPQGEKSLQASTDTQWGIPGKQCFSHGLIHALREKRSTPAEQNERASVSSSPVISESPLSIARGRVANVRDRMEGTPCGDHSEAITLIALADFIIGDKTITPSTIGNIHYLQMYLLLGDNAIDYRGHEGELYKYESDKVFSCQTTPSALSRAELELLTAL